MKKQQNPFAAWADIHEDYTSKWADVHLLMPSNFRMLCALFETKPEQILSAFMWDLSRMLSTATDERRSAALEYFILAGQGQEHYSEEKIRQLFGSWMPSAASGRRMMISTWTAPCAACIIPGAICIWSTGLGSGMGSIGG